MDEQLERFKEFMVQQQAQAAEKLLQLEDLLVRFVQATRDRFVENERRTQENERRTQELDEKFAALLDAQIRYEDRAAKMDTETRERDAKIERDARERDAEIERVSKERDAKIERETRERNAEIEREARKRDAEIEREARERNSDFDRKMAALADAQMRTEETVRRMGERIDKLGERIDNLTSVVERHIVEGHNGRARPEG